MSTVEKPEPVESFQLTCPFPISDYPSVQLAHGGGGRLMHQLIQRVFRAAFDNPILAQGHDAAVVDWSPPARLAFTTDSFVVHPLFFPGGDIGSLAVHGTVNDLAMSGARPLYLSVGFILEEGFPMADLWRIVSSMAEAARATGVHIVTGDTKVVDRGKGDGVYINTAGVGQVVAQAPVAPFSVEPGDVILLSGDVGRHGMAIMAAREGLAFESTIESDSAPVVAPVLDLLEAGVRVHCLRDLTRGGLATALVELAGSCGLRFEVEEAKIPVRPDVHAACEILGLDPLYVACEGRFVAFVHPDDVDQALNVLRAHPVSEGASVIGQVTDVRDGRVVLRSLIGAERLLTMLSGEQLPRIC